MTVAASRRLEDAPPEIRADVPDWCVPLFEASFGGDWAEEGRALAARPPLDLRVNTLLSTRERVISELRETGAKPTALAREGIRIPPIRGNGRHPNVQAEPAFRKGWFEVQDEGSQLAADLAGAGPGMQVLDFCAGAGGKTLALAADMQNRGQIFAYDAEKPRLAPIFDRIRRAGVRDIQVLSKLEQLADLRARMDLVLVDAPCTGSGTWRRRPDAKWRLTQKQVDARKAEQAQILEDAKAYVKPGGRLVYITCSVFREENQDQLAAFVENNPEFSPADHGALFEEAHRGKSAVARIEREGGIVLTPLRTGTDGFYFASLQRAG
jgi:16S rRNA (cytosine967-C5)-methyltransferase